MKLTTISLDGFRSYKGLTIDLSAPRLLFAGLNGSGKSGLLNAIRWALTGRCEGTDGRGAGAEVLIPVGEKAADVSVTIDGIGRVHRTYAEKGGSAFSVQGFTGTSQIQQQALYIKLGTTPEFLDAVLSPDVFLNLGHAEAKALVLSLLNVRIPVDGSDVTLDELDVLYKQAFEDRKVAKKVLAGHVVPEAPMAANMPSLALIDAQLAKLRGEESALRQQIGEAVGKRQALQAELTKVSQPVHSLVTEDLSAEIATAEATLRELEASIAPPTHAAPPAKSDPQRLQFLRSTVQILQNHVPTKGCVIDSEVPCKTAAKAFSDRLATLNQELRAMDPKDQNASQAPMESPLTAARRRLESLRQQQAQREQAMRVNHERAARAAVLEAELAALPQTADQEAAIKTLQARIWTGEDLLKNARAYLAAVEATQTAESKRITLAAEVASLEHRVELLGPNGVRVKALADALGTFTAAVNPYLKPFGWKIGFSLDPWTVLANNRPVETYSRSERYRIGIALQLGIAQMSGLNFAVVDEIDMLDVTNRAAVTKMLLQAPLDQILIMGTREESQALPKIPNVLCYRLSRESGTTAVLERVAGTGAAA